MTMKANTKTRTAKRKTTQKRPSLKALLLDGFKTESATFRAMLRMGLLTSGVLFCFFVFLWLMQHN